MLSVKDQTLNVRFGGVKMFNGIFRVVFCHLLGISVFCIIIKSTDMVFGTSMIDFLLKTIKGVWVLNGIGIISIYLGIWDGQFVRMVKKNHWSQR